MFDYIYVIKHNHILIILHSVLFINEEGLVTSLIIDSIPYGHTIYGLMYLPPLGNSGHACLRFDFNV